MRKKIYSGMMLIAISSMMLWCSWSTDTELPKSRDEFDDMEKFNIHMCLMNVWENCDFILDVDNKKIYADAIKEQCDHMPGMPTCDQYFSDQ